MLVLKRLRFPITHVIGGRFYLPSGGEPALPRRVLLEFGHPVRLLEFGIQHPKVPGQVIDLLLEDVHIDGTDELDLIAGIAVIPDIGRIQDGAEHGKMQGQGVLPGNHLGQSLSLPDGLLVGPVNPDDQALQLLQAVTEFLEEVLRLLGRLVAFLHLHVVGKPFTKLGDPPLQIRPLVQCFCKFHMGLCYYRGVTRPGACLFLSP